MKEKYITPTVEVIEFAYENVICTSGQTGDDVEIDYGGWAPDVD